MTSGDHEVYIFTRNNSDDIFFTFKGLGYIKDLEDGHPANIVWGFTNDLDNKPDDTKRKKFIEGARLSKTYTVYERNRAARAKCLQHYGYKCAVCDFDFNKVYGEIGENFIHVHHEKELSSIGEEYMLDPINDLKPVCPNCHAMLHKRKPAYSLQELKNIIHN